MKYLFLLSIYGCINIREIFDWNQNMINKMCSFENIAVGEVINNVDSLYVPEDCKYDIVVLKNRLITS
jgi:hypothetical protein